MKVSNGGKGFGESHPNRSIYYLRTCDWQLWVRHGMLAQPHYDTSYITKVPTTGSQSAVMATEMCHWNKASGTSPLSIELVFYFTETSWKIQYRFDKCIRISSNPWHSQLSQLTKIDMYICTILHNSIRYDVQNLNKIFGRKAGRVEVWRGPQIST